MTNQLKRLRERGRLTQEELATLLGVDAASISRWESGERPLTPRIIERLAQIFKIGSWELFLDRKGLRRLARSSQSQTNDRDVEVGNP